MIDIAIATTTWNCSDLAASFLRYHLAHVASTIYVVDYRSTDGTADILASFDSGRVRQLPFVDLPGLDVSNQILEAVRADGRCDWVLFMDPDEFVVEPQALKQALETAPADCGAVQLRRDNVTGLLPDDPREAALRPFEDLNLQVAKPVFRDGLACIPRNDLEPPWIHSWIGPKVVVRSRGGATIGDGDHELREGACVPIEGPRLLHFPIRSWARFVDKLDCAEQDLGCNPHLPEIYAWHLRRWLRMRREGDLLREFRRQFVTPAERDQAVATGNLTPLPPEWVAAYREAMGSAVAP